MPQRSSACFRLRCMRKSMEEPVCESAAPDKIGTDTRSSDRDTIRKPSRRHLASHSVEIGTPCVRIVGIGGRGIALKTCEGVARPSDAEWRGDALWTESIRANAWLRGRQASPLVNYCIASTAVERTKCAASRLAISACPRSFQ